MTSSSDDEQVENPLDAFFGPGKSDRKSSQDLLTEGVGSEGDLDSRLANIFDKQQASKKEEVSSVSFAFYRFTV